MAWWKTRNLKWQMILYLIVYAVTTMCSLAAVRVFFSDELTQGQLFGASIGIPIGLAAAFGYVIAQFFQRRLDRLQFGMIQIQQNNYANRIDLSGQDPFDMLYQRFNAMAAILEDRMKMLQQIGEAAAEPETAQAVLEERKRLARDLHDSVSQQLFAIHMHASSLPMLLERNKEQAQPILEQLIHMSHAAQIEIRSLIAQLRPLELEGQSLSTALERWFPDYCRHNGIKGILDFRLNAEMSEGKEHQLFMIIQEAMANVVKHASAKQVNLTVQETASATLLQISDDGIGFDKELTRMHSYGLSSMRERAHKLGGALELNSRQGLGTTVKVTIPKWLGED